MSTEWMKQHVNPRLVARYDREMAQLRGEESQIGHVVENIKKLNTESDQIESDAELHARALAEDEENERFFRNNKS
jgi:hypothetical protein